ncbi:unnamed protein product [Peronospora belbahrii]|uniref:Cytosol aminopeptidase domain-containing protein n=1 Tax=Peronospora belbahrii TaxID=622444 RepID=A0AAU9KJF4_9STRA|nr:unnamed protein product [Peronospora belbahrii]
MLRRFFSSSSVMAAPRMVQQRVQSKLSLLSNASTVPKTRVMFVSRSSMLELHQSLPFPVSTATLSDFKAKPKERMFVYPSVDHINYPTQRVLLIGLGDASKVTPTVLRDATHVALSTLKTKQVRDVVVEVPMLQDCELKYSRIVELIAQASMLSNYQFDQYLTDLMDVYGDCKLHLPLEDIYMDTLMKYQKNVVEQVTVGEETIFARNLGNERSHIVNPAFMEEVARASSDLPNMSVRVLQQEELKKEGMNMFLSVGQAAVCPPRLVILEYHGNPDSDKKVALVGKGVTFDTGGLNLKPTGSIEDMHTDIGLKVNIVCALALAENAIGSKAVKPLTIVKSHKGITVENSNTDAEGRLVLGDAMSYIQKEYKPKKIIDVATLTGACMVALGEHCAGLFSNSDDLAKKLQETGMECHERCWRLPILPEHTAALKGSHSDSRSTGRGRYGGASTAAAFLQQFVYENVDWAHLDIAGPSNYSSAKSYFPKGATGFGVQLLYSYLKEHEQH